MGQCTPRLRSASNHIDTMTRKSDRRPGIETGEFRALTLSNLLIVIAFFTPIANVIGELRNARSGFLRYSIGLPTTIASASIIVVVEWHLLKLIWMQSEKYASSWVEAAATVLALFVLISWPVASTVVGDSIAA